MAESPAPSRRAMFLPVRSALRPLAAVVLTAAAALGLACPGLAAPPEAAAHGPLGATPPEIVSRYGPVLAHNARVYHHQLLVGGTAIDGDLHGKNGLVIRVVYHQNRSVLLEFVREKGPLAPADITALLASCADNSTWEMGKDSTDAMKLYHRLDGKAIAHWSGGDGSLLVASEGDNPTGDLMDRLLQ